MSEQEKREKKAEYDRNRYKERKGEILERNRSYFLANRERHRHLVRRSALLRQYGLSLEQYGAMLKAQNFACAICHSPSDGKALSVDHCHSTDRVRGLLCQPCNMALGLLKDSTSSLLRAVDYLNKDKEH